jgi:hypothetical protein
LSPEALQVADFINDDDPCDDISSDVAELGIIIRTDYSNEDAWNAFYLRLQDGEKEFADSKNSASTSEAGNGAQSSSTPPIEAEEMGDSDNDGDDSEDESTSIFKIINVSSPQERALVTDISNLTSLRLLTDVDIRPCPPILEGSTRLKQPNKLIDYDGWQEVYSGKHLWIYDRKSNTDQCVRLISHAGEVYGTATYVLSMYSAFELKLLHSMGPEVIAGVLE